MSNIGGVGFFFNKTKEPLQPVNLWYKNFIQKYLKAAGKIVDYVEKTNPLNLERF